MKGISYVITLALVLSSCGGSNDFSPDGITDPSPEVTPDGTDVDVVPDTGDVGGEDVANPDTDGDTITDLHEGSATGVDTDGDGTPDFQDTDSDGDTIPDSDEAGDADVSTEPDDCDADGVPNFQDLDSDDDGLGDASERELGTDPCDEDSDSDGMPDLIEVCAGTDPLDATSGLPTEGNFCFLVPYEADPDPEMDTLVFPTDIQKLDVFFLLDTTGSMSGERENLKTGIVSVISSVRAIIPDTWMGVGKFEDYPVSPYGSAYSDDAFQHIRNVTDDATAIESGVLYIDGGSGGDGPESSVPAMYAVATGLGLGSYLAPQTSCASGTFGYPCFRNDAFPVIVLMTDALFHNGPGGSEPYDSGILGGHVPPTYEETVTELLDAHIKVISVNSGSTYGAPNCRQIAVDTHAVDSYGTPLYFEVSSSGTGIDTTIVDAIDILASDVPIDVSARARDGAGDSLDARVFVESITANAVGGVADPVDPTIVCESGLSAEDTDGDMRVDTFTDVLPGTTVCFDVTPARNTTVPATAEPQVFTLHVDIYGDGFMRLSTKEINFMVPPDFS